MPIPFTSTSTASPAKAKAIGRIGRWRYVQQGWKLIPATMCVVSLWWTAVILGDINRHYTFDARGYPAESNIIEHNHGIIRRKYEDGAKEMATTLQHTPPLVAGISVNEVFNDKWNNVSYYDRTLSPRLPLESEWLLIPHRHNSDDHDETSLETIPKIIHKIYFQHNGKLEDVTSSSRNVNLYEAHRSWQVNNPGYRIEYFDLVTARKYLEHYFHRVFLRTFDCIQAYSGKSDFFRFALLYREGGWHSDWKQTCLQPGLLDRLSNGTDLFVAQDNGNVVGVKERCIQNAFVGSCPYHPVIGKHLELAMSNVQTKHYGSSPLHATSTCVLGKAFDEVKGGDEYKQLKAVHKNNSFFWQGKKIVLHKCPDCGRGQDWKSGNNYNKLWESRNYYCEDAASIFHVSE
jgi:hypothetical protein